VYSFNLSNQNFKFRRNTPIRASAHNWAAFRLELWVHPDILYPYLIFVNNKDKTYSPNGATTDAANRENAAYKT